LKSHPRSDPVLAADDADDADDDAALLALGLPEELDEAVVLEPEPPEPPGPPATNACPHAAVPRVATKAIESEGARGDLLVRRLGPSMPPAV
jgi:hypothetical protein